MEVGVSKQDVGKRQEATTDSVSEEREPTEAVWDPSPVLWDGSIDFPTFFLTKWTVHTDTIGCGRWLLRHERFGFDNLNSGKSWDRLYDCPVYEYLSPQPVSLVNCDLLQVLERWSTLFSGEPRLQWYVFENCLYYLYEIRLKAHQNRCPQSTQGSQISKPSTEAAMSIAISRKVQKQLGKTMICKRGFGPTGKLRNRWKKGLAKLMFWLSASKLLCSRYLIVIIPGGRIR